MGTVFRTAKGKNKILKMYNEGLKMWPSPNKQLMVPTSFGETFVMSSGKDDGEAVLLFHGSSTNAAIWMYDAQLLGTTHKVYAVDIIGEPGKSAESRPALECSDYCRWMSELMDGLGIEKAAVIGNSLGAWMALCLAVSEPQRVTQLLLLAPAGFAPLQKTFILKSVSLALQGRKGRDKLNKMIFGSSKIPEETLAFEELLRKYYIPRPFYTPVFSDEQLQKLSMPILFIGGEDDPLVDIEQSAKRLEDLVPQAQIKILKNKAHALFNMGPEIAEFLEKNKK